MEDYDKTKQELIEELKTLRERVVTLKSKIAGFGTRPRNSSKARTDPAPRTEFHGDIEVVGDFDVVNAKGVNFSEGGICFELSEGLPFEMQFKIEGKVQRHRARLIWVKRLPERGYRFGFKFVPLEPHATI